MNIKTVLFDLDGTLLPMDQDTFVKAYFGYLSKKLYPIYQEKLNCDGLTISQNNDYGQEVKHYHMHLTPRYKKDGWEHNYNKKELRVTKKYKLRLDK